MYDFYNDCNDAYDISVYFNKIYDFGFVWIQNVQFDFQHTLYPQKVFEKRKLCATLLVWEAIFLH